MPVPTLRPRIRARPARTRAAARCLSLASPRVVALVATSCVLAACGTGDGRTPEALHGDAAAPSITHAPWDADAGHLAVRCGRLIDGIGEAAGQDATVLIRDGRIVAVGRGVEAAAGVPLLDLTDYTCLPGLIDMHTHIMESPEDTADLSVYFEHTLADTLATGRRHALATLMAGFTSVRNLGVYYGLSSAQLREEIAVGQTPGPRMQIAGFYLTVPGGGGDLLIPGVAEADIPPRLRLGVARGPEQFAVRAQAAVDAGVDVLKVIASGAVLAYGGVPGAPEMTPEEIAAVVRVGHAAGLPVTAHAHGALSIRQAIEAGVDSIEHASLLDEAAIRLAAERQIAFSMDVYGGDWIAEEGRRQNWPAEFLRKNDETTLTQREGFRKAHAAGVPIVFGSDAGIFPHGLNGRQFRYMVQWGMTPMEAIHAATSLAARVAGREDDIGALRPGRLGDLIAVAGDPLEDITLLENVPVVIQGGHIFKADGLQLRAD